MQVYLNHTPERAYIIERSFSSFIEKSSRSQHKKCDACADALFASASEALFESARQACC